MLRLNPVGERGEERDYGGLSLTGVALSVLRRGGHALSNPQQALLSSVPPP